MSDLVIRTIGFYDPETGEGYTLEKDADAGLIDIVQDDDLVRIKLKHWEKLRDQIDALFDGSQDNE